MHAVYVKQSALRWKSKGMSARSYCFSVLNMNLMHPSLRDGEGKITLMDVFKITSSFKIKI